MKLLRLWWRDGNTLLSNVVASSMDQQAQYGGVVPELAARSHIEVINVVIEEALAAASCSWRDIDAIAVTYGPGLGGSLLIGVLTARTLAIAHRKPLYAINHVEAHVYSNFLTKVPEKASPKKLASREHVHPEAHKNSNLQLQSARLLDSPAPYRLPSAPPVFPFLALIVSGGHCQLAVFRGHGDYTLLGQTGDDAIGEAFDKVAKMLGYPYPGGPRISELAKSGDSHAYQFPKAKLTTVSPALQQLREEAARSGAHASSAQPATSNYDFSFSGLKTAVLRAAQQAIGEDHTFPSKNLPERLSEAQKADIAASFQRIAIETVVDKTLAAYEEFAPASVVIAGGVAASPELRRQLAERLPCSIEYTDPRLCTDNGAMIATLGHFHMKQGCPAADPYSLDIAPNLSM
ncbi:tRNA (adenosine(37)-N6)-threonylcarbamoyltransferase complex transferase subunit TsaD [Candidatus Saccharibacteria bacterium]|nr:MAG: tRNA (adenosine(37)-N6)-threonylcarbamoyltransferase complex transferase subunit TsaD [Candidatus Saccharibacteria bacterium]